MPHNSDDITPTEVRCPVCKARQPWSTVCRRCKCDLTLLHEAAMTYFQLCHDCCQSLCENQPREALKKAEQAQALHPTEESVRLLAVCHLLLEDYPAAAEFLHGFR